METDVDENNYIYFILGKSNDKKYTIQHESRKNLAYSNEFIRLSKFLSVGGGGALGDSEFCRQHLCVDFSNSMPSLRSWLCCCILVILNVITFKLPICFLLFG